MRKFTRTRLGPHFSEAARLLWRALPDARDAQRALAALLGVSRGYLVDMMYGDKKAGRALGLRIQNRLGIAPELWDQSPTEPFVLPAIQAAEEARANLATLEAKRRSAAA